MKIKTGDTVAIIAGSDQFSKDKKGNKVRNTGRVLKVLRDKDKVVVEGINKVKKHERPKTANDKGGIREVEAPIHISNVALLDPKTNQPTRVGYKIEGGVKVRYTKDSNTILDPLPKKKGGAK